MTPGKEGPKNEKKKRTVCSIESRRLDCRNFLIVFGLFTFSWPFDCRFDRTNSGLEVLKTSSLITSLTVHPEFEHGKDV